MAHIVNLDHLLEHQIEKFAKVRIENLGCLRGRELIESGKGSAVILMKGLNRLIEGAKVAGCLRSEVGVRFVVG